MTFLLYTGPRLSEASRLTWADLELNASGSADQQARKLVEEMV